MPEEKKVQIGEGYPSAQLAKAYATATQHADPATRQRAAGRAQQWASVLRGMASGVLRIGSRTPVAGLPAWVTPTVIRGGFATGQAAAAGPVTPSEAALQRAAGLPEDRAALFEYLLTEHGLAELDALLTNGNYRVGIPEDAVLLVVAWLAAAGEPGRASELVEAVGPFAGHLKFAPDWASEPPAPRSIVWRQTGRETSDAVASRRPNPRVEAMRETLTVWNPLADAALDLWLATVEDGQVAAAYPNDWHDRARSLLQRYDELRRQHRLARKHERAKENLSILLRSLRAVSDGSLTPRQRGMLQHAVDAMVARRGRPGSEAHQKLRAGQARIAALPGHQDLARIVVRRLGTAAADRGLASVDHLLVPVSEEESVASGVPAGSPIPPSISRVVERGLAAPPEELIARGVVPSAEVLAALVPRISAATIAETYDDARLGELMAATYEAFRRRRSLLLLDLEHQVRFEELPWVAAVSSHRRRGSGTAGAAAEGFAGVAELALDAFPATILPSPLVSELDVLSREAMLGLPLVEELAADIFMGTFSEKFVRAAQLAGALLDGSLYARYYGIDYAEIANITDLGSRFPFGPKTSASFDAICARRAANSHGRGFSVAANGAVIEQSQILTTHNLAAIASARPVRDRGRLDWAALAERSFAEAVALAAQLHNNRRPLRTIKDLAYAWRQTIFFLSMAEPSTARAFVAAARGKLGEQPDHVTRRLGPVLDGLERIVDGGAPDPPMLVNSPRRLLGWTTTRHWILDEPGTA